MMDLTPIGIQLLHGLIFSLMISLTALGLVLILGMLNCVNMAHGDLFMMGAFLMALSIDFIPNFWIALAISCVVVGGICVVIEFFCLRPIYTRKEYGTWSFIVTTGISIILVESARIYFEVSGKTFTTVVSPIQGTITIMGVDYPLYRIFVGGIAVIAIILLWLFVNKTEFGAVVRATIHDPVMAECLGINVNRIRMVTFITGGVLAAFVGGLLSVFVSIYAEMGEGILVWCLTLVIFAGMGSIFGVVCSALLLGELYYLLCLWLRPLHAEAVVFLLLLLMLIIRPRGLFGR